MTFESDSLIDRKRLKRRLANWRLAAVIAVAGVGLALFARFDSVENQNHIARLSVNGIIVEDIKRVQALGRVARDRSAKALIVRINSPGGTVVGSESLYFELRKVAAKKPVVAVIGTLGASGGYMVALGGDRIFARAGTITGSIGVIMQTTDITGLLGKLGITAEAIKSAPLKASPSPLEPMSDEARAASQAIIDDMYGLFIEMVAEQRGFEMPRARALADGRVYTGRQAVANGLIDAIGGEAEARDWLAAERDIPRSLPVHDVIIDRPGENWLVNARVLSQKMLLPERLTLDGLISLWHPGNW